MHSPLKCDNPGCDEQVGWHYEYQWGPRGCDPPEDELFDDDEELWDSQGRVFCSVACKKEANEIKEESDGQQPCTA